ncbi:MAG TPA: hypothetical protein VLF66_04145, partial [Thermoanaerobaculia bacterium]|nr:hypothetical protein [Thermoanaerobaculia bacterium]
AEVEAGGALHVAERHTMVFDGDWNGGERSFRLGPGQGIDLLAVTRIDPETGKRRRVRPGSLGRVDEYAWTDATTLRWRSRSPSDPPFEDQAITYVLEYRLTGVLRPRGDDLYLLDHDFAFPDRAGTIERFRLDLSVDPAFEPVDEVPTGIELTYLVPGEGVVRTVRLRYLPEGRPAAARPGPLPLALRVAVFLAALAAMAWMVADLRRRETALGRGWGRLPRPAGLGRAWIEEHLLPLRPEAAGALWDRGVGRPEVAALLARLVAEGKLESEVEEKPALLGSSRELRLRLVADRDDFTAYERALIDKLFYGGRSEVTTTDLQERYKTTGFDPVGTIRPGLERHVRESVPASRSRKRKPSPWPAAILTLSTLALVGLESLVRPDTAGVILIVLAAGGAVPYLAAWGMAVSARNAMERLDRRAIAFAVPVAVTFAAGLLLAFAPELLPGVPPIVPPALFGLLALALAPVATWRSVTHAAMTREGKRAIAARAELLHARRHLEAELGKERPDLDDAWFPYLLALGLSNAVDRWSSSFGGRVAQGAAVAA